MVSPETDAVRPTELVRAAFWCGGESTAVAAQRAWRAGLVLWLAVMVATPIALWTLGPASFAPMAMLGVLAHAVATSIPLVTGWGWRRWLGLLVPFAIAVWLVEWFGVRTGFPFGSYSYTASLQPQALQVPIWVPIAWYMMLVPSWAVGSALAGRERAGFDWRHAAVAATAFTAWDLYLDPQMVAQGLWIWSQPGAYFGVPLLNFAGWWVVSFVLTLVLRPIPLPRLPLLAIYSLTWLFQGMALGVFWGQPGPALCGFLAMGTFVLLAWRGEVRRW